LKKAFTLIELLVVIAIIAILAAILFPVFAQAKQAAKGAASISNNKQIMLGSLMYAGDSDDIFMPQNGWEGGNFSGYFSWVWVVYPYMKSSQLFEDPLGPKIVVDKRWTYVDQVTITPTFGYNYTALSPFPGADPGTSVPQPISQTALAQPANTVAFTGKFENASESNLGTDGYYSYGDRGPDTTGVVDPPDCSDTPSWCFDNWGIGSFWERADYVGIKSFAAGKLTGGVSFRNAEKATVAFGDGSVRKVSPGALAAGTNWTKTINSGDIRMIDKEKYLWDIE
jgi:prepilin-type N-terminal cleavage/methylation domain-containing protein